MDYVCIIYYPYILCTVYLVCFITIINPILHKFKRMSLHLLLFFNLFFCLFTKKTVLNSKTYD